MNYIAVIFSTILFSSTIIAVALAIYSVKSTIVPGAKYFTLLCSSVAIFCFGYCMELQSKSIEISLFWNEFRYLAGPFLCLFAVLMAFEYTGNTKIFESKARLIGLVLVPTSIIVIRFTNDIHHLYYTSVALESNGFFNILVKSKGPLYYYYILFLTICMICSTVIYLKTALNSSTVTHVPISLMVLASLFPWLTFYMNMTNTAPYGIDYSAILLCPSSILYMLGIFRFRILKTIPIARNTVFHHSKDGIIILDYNENIIDFNQAAISIFEGLTDKHLNHKFYHLFPKWLEIGDLSEENESFEFSLTKSGAERHYSLENIRLKTKTNSTLGWLFTVSDITKLINNQKQLEVHATVDDLTSLFNRRFFFELFYREFESVKQRNTPICLIMFDIDFFKKVNDNYGHQAGDEVLKYVATTSKDCVRVTDVVARYGGEEFMILLPKTKIDDAIDLAELIRSRLEMSYCDYNNSKINVTASFGVAGFENYSSGLSVEILIKAADRALYSIKTSGRNKVAFQSVESQGKVNRT
ncbi:diguanylate cyclase [Clostridium tagluense]|uniref:histidine kinase N-terminal 7TM domain-containing diguanylate cyclase n=1 Tax=Clostridium tagluense TaxID=360422 RepID=UPI001CF3D9AD|nr:diguanylate cyclase [Clostridium tagluense]MCB2309725.1 diguanylate cyclase [Clostridium tagluense]MCB2314745.1 diguanylate cyclase [Clostridium tagluense]MCB2319594.1 diguanylate cyclase [Clostridium tagluense]MCB2324319.1 diguanylate cyclase [Clostridium tagluense]MCB2329170.1 diguanylate cyclase [Clostridium tagluense]